MNYNKKPYWYKLIKLLKAEGVINTGLTIPYIFGAYKELGVPFKDINQLINTILESKTDKYPVIQKCTVIGHHVVMLEDKEVCNKVYKKDRRFANSTNDNWLFISTNTDLGNSIDRVAWNLTVGYENPISREEFSWNNTEERWKRFSQAEVDRIKIIK